MKTLNILSILFYIFFLSSKFQSVPEIPFAYTKNLASLHCAQCTLQCPVFFICDTKNYYIPTFSAN